MSMYIKTDKNQIQLISKLIINEFHYNFIIVNNKLVFTHKVNIDQIEKLLKRHYLKYKLYKIK